VDDAVDNLRLVLAGNPGDAATMRRLAEVLTLRGILLLRDGKRDEAVVQFDEALQLDPSNEDARMNREQALGR
jgi:Flp pilus assembly protein TadD